MVEDTEKEGAVARVRALRRQDGWMGSPGVGKEDGRTGVGTDNMGRMKRTVGTFLPLSFLLNPRVAGRVRSWGSQTSQTSHSIECVAHECECWLGWK